VDIQTVLLYGALLLWKLQQKPSVALKQGPAGCFNNLYIYIYCILPIYILVQGQLVCCGLVGLGVKEYSVLCCWRDAPFPSCHRCEWWEARFLFEGVSSAYTHFFNALTIFLIINTFGRLDWLCKRKSAHSQVLQKPSWRKKIDAGEVFDGTLPILKKYFRQKILFCYHLNWMMRTEAVTFELKSFHFWSSTASVSPHMDTWENKSYRLGRVN